MEGIKDVAESINSTIREINKNIADGTIRPNDGFVCEWCYGSGWQSVRDPQRPQDLSAYGVAKCYHCRYWDFVREDLAKKGTGKL